MSLLDLIRWSLRQIRVRIMESILIILGIALGVAVITAVVGLSQNFQEQANQSTQSISMRVLTLLPVSQDHYSMDTLPFKRVGLAGEEQIALTYKDYQAIREVDLPGIKYIWVASSRSEMKSDAQPVDYEKVQSYEEHRKWELENLIRYLLIVPEALDVAGVTLLKGDTIREADVLNKNRVALIGDELAQRTFGAEDPIGQVVKLREREFTVIGIVHREIPASNTQELYEYIPGLGNIQDINHSIIIPYFSYEQMPMMVNGKEEGDILQEGIFLLPEDGLVLEKAYAQVRNYVEQTYGERIVVTGAFRFEKENRQSILAVTKAIGILACAALLIAAINILNLMMARVLRRIKQIGIARAVGGSKRDLFRLFLSEALLLGLIGSIVGLGMGYGALQLLSNLIHAKLELTLLTYIAGVGAAVLTSLIFGLYPALQAANAHPAEALKKD